MNQLILIAESKTMSSAQCPVTTDEFAACHADGEERAESIISILREYSEDELSAMLKISPTLARAARRDIYGFADKSCGLRVAEAFTGVVFKALDYSSLDSASREYADRHILVLSSLYGLLRLSDIIKPYRLDYSARFGHGDTPLWSRLRSANTIALCRMVRDNGVPALANLLPADASKGIDWKIVKRFCPVVIPDFRVSDGSGGLRTPHARRLKELRGLISRDIIERRIPTPEALRNSPSDDYMYLSDLRGVGHPAFIAD